MSKFQTLDHARTSLLGAKAPSGVPMHHASLSGLAETVCLLPQDGEDRTAARPVSYVLSLASFGVPMTLKRVLDAPNSLYQPGYWHSIRLWIVWPTLPACSPGIIGSLPALVRALPIIGEGLAAASISSARLAALAFCLHGLLLLGAVILLASSKQPSPWDSACKILARAPRATSCGLPLSDWVHHLATAPQGFSAAAPPLDSASPAGTTAAPPTWGGSRHGTGANNRSPSRGDRDGDQGPRRTGTSALPVVMPVARPEALRPDKPGQTSGLSGPRAWA
ncbi:hypothetical protein FB451DRAFT_1519300 [Mycena latifolia]|nr:hypothetical protein FB451DRAFT_1519300 [Mycena latifolia]